MKCFTLEHFYKEFKFQSKHPEIFLSKKKKQLTALNKLFKEYAKFMNTKGNTKEDLAVLINKKFDISGSYGDKFTSSSWADLYLDYCVDKTRNDVWTYQKNLI